jgi:hypothetical protein
MAYAQRQVRDSIARYVIVEAAYEADATKAERSLRALAPQLADAGLTMITDSPAVREWAGVIDGHAYAHMADAWALDRKPATNHLMVTEYGELAFHAYTWDGMEWEGKGSSPVVWMRLRVSSEVRPAASRSARET